ncbi:MAG: universal stress protein [Gemmatimonadaceae bacterium]|nr:universal stress protein [Gemmatimonadaceae bacterium]
MYRTLFVPIDGSAHSARALPVAVAIARKTGARIQLALVHDPSAYIPFVPGEVAIPVFDQDVVNAHRVRDQQVLDASVAHLRSEGLTADGVVLEGTVVEALEEHCQGQSVDLIIMTTHGRSGFERLRVGSVASAFLSRATSPVLLVRGSGSESGDDTPALPTGPVLCALDGSAFAEHLLPHAQALASVAGVGLLLGAITVPHAIPMAPFGAEALLADDTALAAEEEGRAGYLERLAATLPPGTQVETVTDMSVARALVELASKRGAGAIALATHGRGGFKRFMLGSVTDEVIRHATTPVLVYRPSDSEA